MKDEIEWPFLCLIKNTQRLYYTKIIDEKVPNIGDIVVYSSTEDKHIFIHPEDFKGDEGQPIAIVVIPSNISKSISSSLNGKNVCISLANMDASNAKEGTADNLFEGPVPITVGTYTNSKGVVTENTSVNTSDGHQIFDFEGKWNGRVNAYASKHVVDFDTKEITDYLLNRYEVNGQIRTKFTPSRAKAVSHKFNQVISDGRTDVNTLLPAPSGQYSVKGYISQEFYNPKYTLENGDHYVGGFKDNTYPSHYWYASCVEGSESKLRIPCPITQDMKFNKVWLTVNSLTADFNGKLNTEELVADAMTGVYDEEDGNLIKWDGTSEGLWGPYKVSKYTSVCQTGYDKNGKAYNLSNYNKIQDEELKASVELYMFPTKYNNSGSLMDFWNYAALTCNCFSPSGSGTNQGDWYCPASGEAAFALAFADKINYAVDTLVAKGFKAVGLTRPTTATNPEIWSYEYKNGANPYYRGNEDSRGIILTSTAYDDNWMIDMYMGHASFYARALNQASLTRAFIQL